MPDNDNIFEQLGSMVERAEQLAKNLEESPLTRRLVEGVQGQLEKESLTNKPQPKYRDVEAPQVSGPKLADGQWLCAFCGCVAAAETIECGNCGAGKQ